MAELLSVQDHDVDIDAMIVGNSPAIENLKQMILRVAHSDAAVMITGPSGAGKEMVASAIHSISRRNSENFVALNCGAIPKDLMESELFGHERGSFTGANNRRIGRFEEADRGTLFLDEIGDMPYDMQVKLLRVLEDGNVSRIGGSASVPVNVRIISATHQDIDGAISDKKFREDLYFRLGVVPITVPDLASRVSDIPLLIQHFQKDKKAAQIARFDNSALERLAQHSWPGNVRELRNIVERANVLFGGEMIAAVQIQQLLSLSPRCSQPVTNNSSPAPEPVSFTPEPAMPVPSIVDKLASASRQFNGPINLRETLENMELDRIHAALESADGVISEAARLLTLKRTTLIEKMKKYGVEKLC